jgi:hypothetical protein
MLLNALELVGLGISQLSDRPEQLRPRPVRDDELPGRRAARFVDEDAELEALAGGEEALRSYGFRVDSKVDVLLAVLTPGHHGVAVRLYPAAGSRQRQSSGLGGADHSLQKSILRMCSFMTFSSTMTRLRYPINGSDMLEWRIATRE